MRSFQGRSKAHSLNGEDVLILLKGDLALFGFQGLFTSFWSWDIVEPRHHLQESRQRECAPR